jgi:hypothetical protein
MQNKSILRQLKKYQPKEEDIPQVQVPNWEASADVDLWAIAYHIARVDNDAPSHLTTELVDKFYDALTKKLYKKLGNMPILPYMNKLYPIITLARYHLYYNHQWQTSEESVDAEIADFMTQVDIDTYKPEFMKACDEAVRKIMLVRALQATFQYGKIARDNLPEDMRSKICSMLEVSSTTTLAQAVKIQDAMNKVATMEQLILGRFGYLMMWNSLKGSQGILDELKPRRLTSQANRSQSSGPDLS